MRVLAEKGTKRPPISWTLAALTWKFESAAYPCTTAPESGSCRRFEGLMENDEGLRQAMARRLHEKAATRYARLPARGGRP